MSPSFYPQTQKTSTAQLHRSPPPRRRNFASFRRINEDFIENMHPHPHDALFRTVFSEPENASGQLQAILPPPLAARFDWSTLSREPGSFVDGDLEGRHTDLLFSISFRTRRKQRTFIYALVEHLCGAPHKRGRADVGTLLRYYASVNQGSAATLRNALAEAAGPEVAEGAMTTMAEQWVAEGVAKGKAEGKAEAVVEVLEARGLHVTREQRTWILSCVDAEQLSRWMKVAVSATSVDALFVR